VQTPSEPFSLTWHYGRFYHWRTRFPVELPQSKTKRHPDRWSLPSCIQLKARLQHSHTAASPVRERTARRAPQPVLRSCLADFKARLTEVGAAKQSQLRPKSSFLKRTSAIPRESEFTRFCPITRIKEIEQMKNQRSWWMKLPLAAAAMLALAFSHLANATPITYKITLFATVGNQFGILSPVSFTGIFTVD